MYEAQGSLPKMDQYTEYALYESWKIQNVDVREGETSIFQHPSHY